MKDKVTQADWSKALVSVWLRHGTILGAMLEAAGVCEDEKISWPDLDKLFVGLTPRIAPHMNLKQQVAPYIARFAREANDALWDGRINDAIRLMGRGGRTGRSNQERDISKQKLEDKKNSRGVMAISLRERDKRHDWKTVK